jgi:hypothetical protein
MPKAEPGYTTTEFYVALVTSFIGLLTTLGVIHPSTDTVNAILGFVALVAPILVFVISGGVRKQGTAA